LITDRVAAFDALYRDDADPWSTSERWYEERKRGLVLASLPKRRFADAYEAGCGNGNLSVELAARCDVVEASDASREALVRAKARPALPPNIRFVQHLLPADWPDRAYELIVLSEVLYFLAPADIDSIAARVGLYARDADTVIACDWRAPIEGHSLTGEEAHRRFGRTLAQATLCEYIDDDLIITVWGRDARSLAVREGIR